MTSHTIQEASRRSGLSEPTVRYYEQVGLVGPIDRDASSRHRVYADSDVQLLQTLACLRAVGLGIQEMRTYRDNLARRQETAAEQRDLLLRHAERVEEEIAALHVRLAYLREKASLWDARDAGDPEAESAAMQRAGEAATRLVAIR